MPIEIVPPVKKDSDARFQKDHPSSAGFRGVAYCDVGEVVDEHQ